MPSLPDDAGTHWDRVTDLFATALDLPEAERAGFLAEACAGDDPLRAEVEALLAAQPAAVAGFDALAVAAGSALAALAPPDEAASDTEGPRLQPGDRLGHYRIEAPLGTGGMGTVYRAFDTRLERPVALKLLHAPPGAASRARLLREARAAAALDHPHLCTVHAVEEDGARVFLVMPCYEGETLRARLRRGPLPRPDALAVAEQIADALAAVHAAGVVHRDLKPGNVMLGGEPPSVHLLDFGIAHLEHGERLTRSGARLGTVGYMAPEQVRGEAADPATDLWALGALLCEMLTGARPFERDTEAATLYAVLEDAPEGLDRLDPDVAALVERLLAKRPADRPASAAAVRDDLRALQAGVPTGGRRRRAGLRLPWIVAAVFLLAVGGLWLARPLLAPPPAADPALVAVMPFAIHGSPDLGYLREGMVDLLATQLDGVGALRTVDPNALLSRAGADVLAPAQARRLADEFGAGRFVLGRVTDTGAGLRLHASLYDAEGAEEARAQADAAAPEQLPAALDALARQLVAAQLDHPDQQLASLAARTTASFPALRAYLDGERLLRAARFEEAEAALARAVAADSAFALAWYRLARATGWTGHTALNHRATAQALRLADALPLRTRTLLEGYRAFRAGDADAAERRYRDVLARYPDDAEAWLLLSEALFHYNPSRGRPTAEALGPLLRARRYAPSNHELLVHLMDLAAQRGDAAALDSLTAQYLDGDGGDSALEARYRALRTLTQGGETARSEALAILRAAGPEATEQALTRLALMLEDRSFASDLAALLTESEEPTARAAGLLHLALFDAADGDWGAAEAHFARAADVAPGWALIHRALIAAAAEGPVPEAAVVRIRDEVAAWQPPAVLSDGQHAGELGAVRRYLLGLLDLRLGRTTPALDAASSLEAEPSAFARTLARTLRAYADLQAGRPESALARLDAATFNLPFAQRDASPLYSLAFDRHLRAEALHHLGRPDEAAPWRAALHDGYAFWGAPYPRMKTSG